MAIKYNREAYDKVFNDLEQFKHFCATAWTIGYKRSYVFDERDLYNNKSEAWRMYVGFTKGKRPKWVANGERKPFNGERRKPNFQRRK
jgi:hypothetical protein